MLKVKDESIRIALCVAVVLFPVVGAQPQQRPPAVPLIAHDPYFSVWSFSDKLTDSNTVHWTGKPQPIHGLARIDGKPYRFMGSDPEDVPAMEQTSLKVTPTHTIYEFQAAGVKLTVEFFTPAFMQDLEVLSRPVTYLTIAADGPKGSTVSVLIDVDPIIAVNSDDEPVTWGRARTAGAMQVLSVGSRDQRVLNRAGDDVRIDWGYFRLGVPKRTLGVVGTWQDPVQRFRRFGSSPNLSDSYWMYPSLFGDDMDMPKSPRDGAPHLAVEFDPMPSTSHDKRHVLLAYDAPFEVEYLDRELRPYWRRNGETVQTMMDKAEKDYEVLEERGRKFDEDLTADLEKTGGPAYAQLAILAYRQTLAAHGLAADINGKPLLFPKENFSNGCISTVDVLYPSAPLFLFFNPQLLEAQLRPVLEYASLPRWKWPFAPHDLGTYPLANGQVYGGGERTEDDQMPVEESGNLLILIAAMEQELGNWDFAREFWPQFEKWAAYLRDKGLDPANQLSTDDFAGHLAHNANLSIKAIEGLAAFARIARGAGHADIAADYERISHDMAARWEPMALDGDHYKLAFDKPGTWSQKYNLVWDQILGLGLFPPAIRQTEVAYYLKHLNQFGLMLDNRANYTKLDWEIWTATLADKPADWDALIAPIGRWINQGPTRVPLTDWYDTVSGRQEGFQARSVVGGVYIKMLADRALAEKWRSHP
jgi:hypothetical protein